ncbi:K02A2.6-like [Cordylochernes scorpioides]|uniref:RNA-directed DNA polymerase n=1 Tax=Cordylochernes scorpioides TaxID=51811 RepID=A0ABY6KPR6_9ARAC|nr:K02A2.6-like [Cordylochernes scorpioides]
MYALICKDISSLEDLHSRMKCFFHEPEHGLHRKFWQLRKGREQSVKEYYFAKMKIATKLGLSQELILEGLTSGIDSECERLLIAASPTSLERWLEIAEALEVILPDDDILGVVATQTSKPDDDSLLPGKEDRAIGRGTREREGTIIPGPTFRQRGAKPRALPPFRITRYFQKTSFSRALRGAESKYTITELELLAVVETCKRYHPYISGSHVIVHTDHKALIWLNSFIHTNGRLFRWSLKLSEDDLDFNYNKGCENHEADMLSRLPYSYFLSAQAMKQNQGDLSIPPSKLYSMVDGITYIRLNNKDRIVVPLELQDNLIQKAHESSGHPGISAMIRALSVQYYFKGMIVKIKNYVKNCKECQTIKSSTQPSYGLMGSLPRATKPFDVVALDTVLGLGGYNSAKYCIHTTLEEYRNTPHSTTTFPLIYLLYGTLPSYISDLTNPYPPVEKARTIANEKTEELHKRLFKRYNSSHRFPNLKIGDKVLYRIPHQVGHGKLSPVYYPDPYTVLSTPSPHIVEINKPCQPENMPSTIVNVSKLKLWDPISTSNEGMGNYPFPFQDVEDLNECL